MKIFLLSFLLTLSACGHQYELPPNVPLEAVYSPASCPEGYEYIKAFWSYSMCYSTDSTKDPVRVD